MTTWRIRCGAALAAACLLGACEGGQTGQPTVARCEETDFRSVSADQSVEGVSPRRLGQAFAGTYAAQLLWHTDSPAGGLVGAADELTVVITYSGGDGRLSQDCPRLYVPVTVDVTTRDSGIHESGTAELVAAVGQLVPATFDFKSGDVEVLAGLSVDSAQVVISGTLQSSSASTPSSLAQFSSEQLGSGGAGGTNGP